MTSIFIYRFSRLLRVLYLVPRLCFSHPTPDIKQWESGASDEKAVNNIIWDPVLSGKHLNYMELSAGPNVTMKQNWFKQRMDFWDTLPLVENESQLVDSDNLLDLIYNYFVYLVRL